MKRRKNSVQAYFSNTMSISTWKKGKAIFDEMSNSCANLPDGTYEARLTKAYFEAVRSRPYCIFVYKIDGNDENVIKSMLIESSEGIALLLAELQKLGLKAAQPMDLEQVYHKIKVRKSAVEIEIKNISGIRHINLNKKLEPANEEEFAEEVAEEEEQIVPEEAVATVPTLKVVDPAVREELPVPAEPAPASQEVVAAPTVDIKPGDTILVRFNGESRKAKVLREFPDDYEMSVLLEDGSKVIISGDDVVSI